MRWGNARLQAGKAHLMLGVLAVLAVGVASCSVASGQAGSTSTKVPTSAAAGSTETPTLAAPTPGFGVGVLNFRVEDTVFKWAPLSSASGYRLRGDVTGFRGKGGEDRCAALTRNDKVSIHLDETLASSTTSFSFVSSSADAPFFGNTFDVTLEAVDRNGVVLESSPIRVFGPESGCETPPATVPSTGAPGVSPPNTGSGGYR